MARVIGQAKREFDKAAKEVTSLAEVKSITEPVTGINKTVINQATSASEVNHTITQPAQDPIIVAAKSLGITTLGKTRQELATEITNLTAKK